MQQSLGVTEVRLKYHAFADLLHGLPMAHKLTVNQTGTFYFSQACSEDVFNFFPETKMIPIVLFQSLWIIF